MSTKQEQLEAENAALRALLAAVQRAADAEAVTLPFLAGYLDHDGDESTPLLADLARTLDRITAAKTAGEVSS